jgi:hypothetical protein
MAVTMPDDHPVQPAWEIVYVGNQRQARHSGGLGDGARRTWLTSGLN